MSDIKDNLKARVVAAVDEMAGELLALSRQIHGAPELAFKEFQAAELLTGRLRRSGFQVERGIAGMETAFRATAAGQPGGPTVAILAEYDALPQIGHGCGHNIIGTAAVGAGAALSTVIARAARHRADHRHARGGGRGRQGHHDP